MRSFAVHIYLLSTLLMFFDECHCVSHLLHGRLEVVHGWKVQLLDTYLCIRALRPRILIAHIDNSAHAHLVELIRVAKECHWSASQY